MLALKSCKDNKNFLDCYKINTKNWAIAIFTTAQHHFSL